MKKVVITHAKRSAIGKFLGAFKDISARDLAVAVVKSLIRESGLDASEIQELIFGNARQAGSGPNIARQIAYFSGLGESIPAYTVNKACGSGLEAIILAYKSIALQDAEVIIAGGTENMTRVPFFLEKQRLGYRLGNFEVIDGMYRDGFLCPLSNQIMGETAENLATLYKISREEQDKYALMSQKRCESARKSGKLAEEIVPIELKDERGNTIVVDKDEHPRDGVTLESLSKLPPVFRKDGTVTAGNSSGITDGASAVIVMSEDFARQKNFKPLAYIDSYTSVGVDPRYMGIGPVPAVKELQKKTGLKIDDFDLIELNEAFAAQVLACHKELNFDFEKVNPNGGAIALGHPIGCTGTRIVVTLLYEMKRRNSTRGLATLCISGGMGMAVSFLR